MKAKKLLFEEIACFLALILNHAFAVMDFFRTWPGVSQSIKYLLPFVRWICHAPFLAQFV